MSAYDYNASAKSRCATLYDYNGSTKTAIGTAYDYNGSAATLIFRREQRDAVLGTYATGTFGTAQSLVSIGQKYVSISNGNGTGGYVFQITDLTNYNRIIIVCTLYKTAYTFLKVGVSTNFAMSSYPWPTMLVGSYDNMSEASTQAEQQFTLTYDISSLSGNYQVGCWVYSGSAAPNGVKCIISSITVVRDGV